MDLYLPKQSFIFFLSKTVSNFFLSKTVPKILIHLKRWTRFSGSLDLDFSDSFGRGKMTKNLDNLYADLVVAFKSPFYNRINTATLQIRRGN